MAKKNKSKYNKRYYEKHKEEIRKQQKEYYQKHGKERLEHRKNYYQKRRAKILEHKKGYYQEHKLKTPWLLHYHSAKQRCNDPNHRDDKWYGGKGIQMLLTIKEIEFLYRRDNAKNMEHPSIDRINNDGDYCFDNCRFIEISKNASKGRGQK